MTSNDVTLMSVGVVPLTKYSLLRSSSFNLLFGIKGSKVSLHSMGGPNVVAMTTGSGPRGVSLDTITQCG